MPAKKYSVEQIVAKLREHEKLQGQGLTIPQACKRIGISDHRPARFDRNRPGATVVRGGGEGEIPLRLQSCLECTTQTYVASAVAPADVIRFIPWNAARSRRHQVEIQLIHTLLVKPT